jgi:hypothetical protein
MKEELVLKLVQIQNQFRFMHWQTKGDAKHRTYGMIYDTLEDLIDSFVEAMMGKYGRPVFSETFSIMFQDLSTVSLQQFVDGVCEFLISLSDKLDPKMDSDLLNIRDEMLALINKSKYLFTLEN